VDTGIIAKAEEECFGVRLVPLFVISGSTDGCRTVRSGVRSSLMPAM